MHDVTVHYRITNDALMLHNALSIKLHNATFYFADVCMMNYAQCCLSNALCLKFHNAELCLMLYVNCHIVQITVHNAASCIV